MSDKARDCRSIKGETYGNHRMLHPNGTMMCFIDGKKKKWYLDRNLATEIDEQTIQLTFEPGGPGHVGRTSEQFYLKARERICIVCGTDKEVDLLNKHHVVPACYVRHMPVPFCYGSTHDVLLICLRCHEKYETEATEYKKFLGEQYGCPFHSPASSEELTCLQIQKDSNTLIKHGHEMPENRKEFLKQRIMTIWKKTELTEEDLLVGSTIHNDLTRTGSLACKLLVEKIPDYWDFIENWRYHFLDVMKPQFLPEGWDVHHRFLREKKE